MKRALYDFLPWMIWVEDWDGGQSRAAIVLVAACHGQALSMALNILDILVMKVRLQLINLLTPY